MKLSRLIICMLAALTALSCSTEKGNDITKGEGLPTAVNVKIAGEGTRASGDLTEVEALESTIGKVDILVFKSDGSRDGGVIGATPDESGMVEVTNTTAGERTFIVVANAPVGVFDLTMDRSAAESAVMTLLSSQAPEALVMAGTETIVLEVTEEPSGNEVEVGISRLAARVALTSLVIDLDREAYPDASLTIASVCMNNVNIKYNVKGDATTELKDYSDDPGWGFDFNPAIDDVNGLDPDNLPYFYVGPNIVSSENDSPAYWTANGTEIVLHGEFKESAASQPEAVYYTVKVNRKVPGTSYEPGSDMSQVGMGIRSNTKYNISVKISGPAAGEQYPGKCEVTIKVNDWAYVGQSTEF